MRENSLAKRYAKALIKTITDEKEYRTIKEELEAFRGILAENVEFKAGMETFLFSKQQKREILETLNKKIKFKEKTVNFLLSLVDANRVIVLDDIIYLLEELWFEANGIEKLKVFTAVALTTKLEKKLIESLETSFKKKIIIDTEIDPSLIAGLKVQRGSVFYDFSVNGNLKKLKDALLTDIETSVGEH